MLLDVRNEMVRLTATATDQKIPPVTLAEQLLPLRLLEQDIVGEIRSFELGTHLYPVNSIGYGGVLNNFLEALDWLPENQQLGLVCRVEAFPTQVSQYMELLTSGVRQGKTASQAMCRKVLTQLDSALIDLDNPDGPLVSRLARLTQSGILERGATALVGFKQAVIDLRGFFESQYLATARQTTGCGGLPDGQEIYAQCLRFHTTTSLSPEQVHQLGLAEVSRIETRYFAPSSLCPLSTD